MKRVLRDRNARWYLGGQAFSICGDGALWLAMGIWVKELTGSSSEAGLTFFFFGLASMLAPLAGMVVDRVKRRPLLLIGNLTGAVMVLGLLFVHGRGQVWLIWLVTFVYGLVYSFLSSGQSALLATMLPADMLVDANGFLQTVREGLRLVAPITGAGLFAVFGGGTVAILDSATFLIAAASLCFVHVEETKPVSTQQHWFAELSAGARHIWHTIVLRQMVLATAVACLVFGFFETICFAVVTVGLHRPATFLGVVLAVQGIGAIAGGVTSAKIIRRLGAGPVAGVGLLLVAIAALGFMGSTLLPVFAAAIVFGVCLPWIIVGLMTMLQVKTPNELQGRVSSAADMLISLPQTLSIALGAVLVGLVDYRYLLLVVTGAVTAAAVYLLTRPEQWERSQPASVEPVTAGPEASDVLGAAQLPAYNADETA